MSFLPVGNGIGWANVAGAATGPARGRSAHSVPAASRGVSHPRTGRHRTGRRRSGNRRAPNPPCTSGQATARDRKRLVAGKSVYGPVDLGGRRLSQTKKQTVEVELSLTT